MYIVLINNERSKIQLQAHKSKNPSANAGVFSVSDGGPGRNRPGAEDV